MERVISKFRTFREADEATRTYYLQLSPEQRLEMMFQLRATRHKESDAATGRLARVYRIVELKRG
jgi:hypothetical protein